MVLSRHTPVCMHKTSQDEFGASILFLLVLFSFLCYGRGSCTRLSSFSLLLGYGLTARQVALLRLTTRLPHVDSRYLYFPVLPPPLVAIVTLLSSHLPQTRYHLGSHSYRIMYSHHHGHPRAALSHPNDANICHLFVYSVSISLLQPHLHTVPYRGSLPLCVREL
ncbi:hypothetical protein BDY19DRAFT_311731 [Irpex rosettiformis]|uniref:Uncharacterized protein n=1 Tax=Irpex rosettiformis TaxID=378272 RepID=A0ACB8TZ03_9APHY|nr:hypothetical protein BDY19DRAFT_311731 [Irpex rosettiformis]